jgi:hypothetical protein
MRSGRFRPAAERDAVFWFRICSPLGSSLERSGSRMATEEVDPRFADLDAWALASAMEAMWEGQLAAVAAIGRALPALTAATEAAYRALGNRGA